MVLQKCDGYQPMTKRHINVSGGSEQQKTSVGNLYLSWYMEVEGHLVLLSDLLVCFNLLYKTVVWSIEGFAPVAEACIAPVAEASWASEADGDGPASGGPWG